MNSAVVVCGAGGVLGGAVVAALRPVSNSIIAVGRPGFRLSPEQVRESRGMVHALGVDLTDPEAVASAWEEVDAIDRPVALINVVGGFTGGSLAETSPDDYRMMMSLNLEAAWWSCREAALRFSRAGEGVIINVAARAAVTGGSGSAAYAVSKAALVRMTEVLALELAPHRVRVNAVLPSLIDTEANRARIGTKGMSGSVPPDAIARVIAFLISPDGWPISGASVPVYGWA